MLTQSVALEDVTLAAIAVGNPCNKPGLMPHGVLPESVKAQSKTVFITAYFTTTCPLRHLLDLVDSDKNYYV